MRVAVLFDNFGPYHVARLTAAARVCDVLGVEVAGRSKDYAWTRTDAATNFQRTTLLQDSFREQAKPGELRERMYEVLGSYRPDAVAIPGWSSRAAILALQWSLKRYVPSVLMSESQARDDRRTYTREWIKARTVGLFSAALVGGVLHKEYLLQLGMAAQNVFLGYDIVDNAYYASGASSARANASNTRQRLGLPASYFLASNRFIPKKNLSFLLRAYSRYVAGCRSNPWRLVLLGDGSLRSELEALVAQIGIADKVMLPGFIQYPDLPSYYALASAFVHASTTEQWGLVVNEAMASGLPVLVSNRCGCAEELVRDGENGFQFDPADESELARRMAEIANNEELRCRMARASFERIQAWGPERFATGLQQAVECACRIGPPRRRFGDGLLLRLLAATSS